MMICWRCKEDPRPLCVGPLGWRAAQCGKCLAFVRIRIAIELMHNRGSRA